MAKNFGFKTRQEFIEAIYEGELWICYRASCYVFTYDARGYNCMIDWIDVKPEKPYIDTFSAETVEELIDNVVLYDGVTLNEALEMENTKF